MNRAGYTLIEFLIVLGILAIAIGSSLVFLTTVLRGSNQANVSSEIKQNGQAVLDSLDSQIRNALNAESDGSDKYIKLTRNSDVPLHIKCFFDSSPKTENGWIGMVATTTDNPPISSYLSLTNKNKASGVDINDCEFTVLSGTSAASNPPIVSIKFSATGGIESPSAASSPVNINFDTTISLRQY